MSTTPDDLASLRARYGHLTDADLARIQAANQRYLRSAHAMQSATAFGIEQTKDLSNPDGGVKDLRVGINSAHVAQKGLVDLLIAKGVFTEAEYYEAMATAMEQEVAMHTARWADIYPSLHFS